MRQRRAKIYRKMLQQYSLQFGFREPYQLLVDDTFALALARYKISDPLNQFGNVLQTKKVKPLITQCCMAALYALGKEHQPTVEMAKAWERRMCNHREAIAPTECIKQCIGPENKHRYIVASEQAELRRDLRLNVPALPLMHFTQAVMVLEPMSELTRSRIDDKEESKLNLPASEAGLLKAKPDVEVDIVGAGTAEEGQKDEEAKEGGARRRKRKAPNPLSVRKPKNPKLTMEQKLQREQELKKQKQRAAARARLQATNPEAAKQAEEKSSARRKRKRPTRSTPNATTTTPTTTSTTTTAPATAAEEKSTSKPTEASANGAKPSSKTRRSRTRRSPTTVTTPSASAPASAPASE